MLSGQKIVNDGQLPYLGMEVLHLCLIDLLRVEDQQTTNRSLRQCPIFGGQIIIHKAQLITNATVANTITA